MTEKEIEEKLAFVRFNMECEGFELTEENIRTGRRILSGEISGDEAVAEIIKKYNLEVAEQEKKKKAWNFAFAMNAIANAPEPDPEYLSLIQQEIRGEITTEDIREKLKARYEKKNIKKRTCSD